MTAKSKFEKAYKKARRGTMTQKLNFILDMLAGAVSAMMSDADDA